MPDLSRYPALSMARGTDRLRALSQIFLVTKRVPYAERPAGRRPVGRCARGQVRARRVDPFLAARLRSPRDVGSSTDLVRLAEERAEVIVELVNLVHAEVMDE